MKKTFTPILILVSIYSHAQSTSKEEIQKELKPLVENIKSLQAENKKIKVDIGILNRRLDSLQKKTDTNSSAIDKTNQELGLKITTSETNANQRISAVDESLSKNSLYGIIGVLIAILGSGIIYWLLSKRQQTDKTDIIDQLSKTKTSIEESLVKEFGKQTELMDTQLHLIEQQKVNTQITPNVEPDHSLALKVCGQINVMENNLARMDQNVRGIKHLKRSIENLKDNLSANGYEMPELLGKQFHQGMKVILTSTIPDENIEKDSEVITKVLIPQVNYNNKMIQTAQIEISKGY